MEELTKVESLAELTRIEADDVAERLLQCEAKIKAAEEERDEFIAHYEEKIARAQDICDAKTRETREEIALLTEQLRRYAEVHVTDKVRSVPLPTATLAFRKQPPKFFYDDLKEVSGKDERLIKFVKHNAHEYLKVKVEETVDWAKFKTKLKTDGEDVFYTETGELIDGLHVQFVPDKFTVKLKS